MSRSTSVRISRNSGEINAKICGEEMFFAAFRENQQSMRELFFTQVEANGFSVDVLRQFCRGLSSRSLK